MIFEIKIVGIFIKMINPRSTDYKKLALRTDMGLADPQVSVGYISDFNWSIRMYFSLGLIRLKEAQLSEIARVTGMQSAPWKLS